MTTPQGTNIGSAYGELKLDGSSWSSALTQARSQLAGFMSNIESSMNQLGSNLQRLGTMTSLAMLPVGAAMKSGVETAMSFDDILTEIRARTGLAVDDMSAIREEALRLGRDTQFSANDAAGAYLQLITAGLSADQAFQALEPTMYGAAAGGMELATTADYATNVMSAFGLQASDLTMVMDNMARAAGSSPATMQQVGEALADVGGVAAQYGLSVERTSAIMALFAQRGIRGAEASTQLRSMLRMMNSDTAETQEAWQELGLSLYDASGNVRDMDALFKDLRVRLNSLPVADQNRLIQQLAGAFGQLGFMALLGDQSIADMEARMLSQQDTVTIAEERMNSFAGTMESLRGSVETLMIEAFTPFMNQILKPLAKIAIAFLNTITLWVTQNKELTMGILVLLSALLGVGPALVTIGTAIKLLAAVMFAPWVLLIATVAGVVMFLRAINNDFAAFLSNAASAVRVFLDLVGQGGGALFSFRIALVQAFGVDAGLLLDRILASVRRFQANFIQLARDLSGAFLPMFRAIGTFIGNNASNILNFLQSLFDAGMTLVSLTSPFGIFKTVLEQLFGISLLDIIKQLAFAVQTFFESLNGGLPFFDALRVGLASAFGPEAALFITNIVNAIGSFANSVQIWLTSTAIPAFQSLGANALSVFTAISSFISTHILPVIQHFVGFLGQIWGLVSPGLSNLANWFLNDVIPQVVSIIRDSVLPIIGSLIDFLMDLWINTEPFLIQLVDWFMNTALPAVMNFISGVVLPGIQILIDALGRIWNDVAPFLLQLWDWFLYTGMPLVVNFIETVVIPIIEWLIDTLVDIWEWVSPFLTQLYDWFMTSALPAIMDFITGPVTTVIQGFIDLLAGIWNLVESGLNLLKDGIFGVFSWIQVNVIDPIIGRIQDFINLFTEARDTAAQGIQAGIEGWQWAGQAAGQIGQGLASGQIGFGELLSATGNAIAKEFGLRDNGGWGNAGSAYLIGTGAQPEMFVPSTSGTFIPNADQLGGVNISSLTIHASGYAEGQAAARGFHEEFMLRYRERS